MLLCVGRVVSIRVQISDSGKGSVRKRSKGSAAKFGKASVYEGW